MPASVQEGFFRALKPGEELSDATSMTFVLQGGGPNKTTTVSSTSPKRTQFNQVSFLSATSVTWDNVSGSYSEVKIKTDTGITHTFCTLPLGSNTSPNGTDVELTAATLTVGSTPSNNGIGALLDTANNTNVTQLDLTLLKDEDGNETELTPAETGITYSVDQTSQTMTIVPTGTATTVSFTSPKTTAGGAPTTYTDVDGVKCSTDGANQVVQGQFNNTTVTWTTNATVQLQSYTVTFT